MGGWISLGARGEEDTMRSTRQTMVAPKSTKGDMLRVLRASRRPKSTTQIAAEKKRSDS